MKKALIVATAGGFAIKFELNNIQLLKELGYEIHYAADFNNRVYEFSDEFWDEQGVICHQVDFVKKPFDVAGNIKAYRQLEGIINGGEFRIIHCHTPIAAALTRLAARKLSRTSVLYTAHGFHFYKGAPVSSNIYKLVELVLARYTDRLITINSEDYDNASRFHLRKGGKVIRINGAGVDTARFKRTAPLWKKANKDICRIVSVGELNDNKNHIVAIRAISMLRDYNIQYDIYGNGPAKEKLEQTIRLLKLEDRVHLRGYCEDTAKMLQDADCFVFPSLREGLGLAAVEALAAGIPVIALEQRGSREFLVDGKNGFFAENSPFEVMKSIRKYITLPQEKIDAMSKNAVNSSEKFDIKYTVENMREVYTSIDK